MTRREAIKSAIQTYISGVESCGGSTGNVSAEAIASIVDGVLAARSERLPSAFEVTDNLERKLNVPLVEPSAQPCVAVAQRKPDAWMSFDGKVSNEPAMGYDIPLYRFTVTTTTGTSER